MNLEVIGRVIGRAGLTIIGKCPILLKFMRVKRRLDTVGVCGSNPHAPTKALNKLSHKNNRGLLGSATEQIQTPSLSSTGAR